MSCPLSSDILPSTVPHCAIDLVARVKVGGHVNISTCWYVKEGGGRVSIFKKPAAYTVIAMCVWLGTPEFLPTHPRFHFLYRDRQGRVPEKELKYFLIQRNYTKI